MAYKSLNELIEHEIMNGPLDTFYERIQNELRDFFAHQTQQEIGQYRLKDGSIIMAEADLVLLNFFDRVFSKSSPAKAAKQ